MASETKSCVVKVRPNLQDGPSNGKLGSSSTNRKKIEVSIKQPIDSKQKSVTTLLKIEVKSKTTSSSAKTTTMTTAKVREKKVHTLPGEKYDPPEELEGPAQTVVPPFIWGELPLTRMMKHGLLPSERARKAYEKKQRRQKELLLNL